MHSRRALIASGFALLGAGCTAAPAGGPKADGDVCRYEAVAEPFDPATDVPPAYNRFQQGLAHRASRHGRTTAYYGPRPLKRASYVKIDGAYYYVELADSDTVDLPALVLSVLWNPGRSPPPNSPVVSFPNLSESDKSALRSAVYGGLYRPQVHPETTLEFSASPVPYPGGTDNSTFADKGELWVRWEGRAYEVTVHRTDTMEKLVHEYTAERVAGSVESFRALIADRYIVRLDDLSPDVQAILDAAVTGGYHETTRSPSQAWHRLLDRLRETAFPEAHYTWYVEYDGAWYTLFLSSYESCRN